MVPVEIGNTFEAGAEQTLFDTPIFSPIITVVLNCQTGIKR